MLDKAIADRAQLALRTNPEHFEWQTGFIAAEYLSASSERPVQVLEIWRTTNLLRKPRLPGLSLTSDMQESGCGFAMIHPTSLMILNSPITSSAGSQSRSGDLRSLTILNSSSQSLAVALHFTADEFTKILSYFSPGSHSNTLLIPPRRKHRCVFICYSLKVSTY